MTLHISKDFWLPDESITETFAILAKKRVGKSNAAVVMAEEMYDAGLPWVAIDPKGDWWGMRSNGAGDGPGLAVLVLGGEHADLPLPPTSGEVIADLVAEQHITCILDVSDMSGADQRRFLTAFANRLYRKNRDPLHVFCEEANVYIPQVVRSEDATMVGAFERLVKQGGFHGIGTTLITQRSASLNKNVLTQTETMIAMRTTAPQDKKVIKEWLDEHDAASAVMSEISSLGNGAAWVISPHFLETVEKIQFRRRGTFDSGATPKIGEKRVVPKALAELDLGALRAMMADTVEKVEGDNPILLRKRIADLEREVTAKGDRIDQQGDHIERLKAQLAERPPETVEVSVLTDDDRKFLEDYIEQTAESFAHIARDGQALVTFFQEKMAEVRGVNPPAAHITTRPTLTEEQARSLPPAEGAPVFEPRPRLIEREDVVGPMPGDTPLNKAEKTILTVLAQYVGEPNVPMTRSAIALRGGYAVGGGGFKNALSSLRTKGLIQGSDPVTATQRGLDVLGPVDPLPTGWTLVEQQLANPHLGMGKAHRAIIEFLWETSHQAWPNDVIAESTGYDHTGGGFKNAMSRLRSTNLIVTENGLSTIHPDLRNT